MSATWLWIVENINGDDTIVKRDFPTEQKARAYAEWTLGRVYPIDIGCLYCEWLTDILEVAPFHRMYFDDVARKDFSHYVGLTSISYSLMKELQMKYYDDVLDAFDES